MKKLFTHIPTTALLLGLYSCTSLYLYAAPNNRSNNQPYYVGFHADMTSAFWQQKSTRGGSPWVNANSPMAFNQGGFQFGTLLGSFRAEASVDFSAPQSQFPFLLSLFVKGSYDVNLGQGVSMFPVVGIGLVHSFQTTNYNSETDFAWLIGAGVGLALNDQTSISAEYHWTNVSSDPFTIWDADGNTRVADGKNTGQNTFSLRWNCYF